MLLHRAEHGSAWNPEKKEKQIGMTEQKKTSLSRREKRVRRLKKIIILSIAAGIMIPIILCIYLLIRVSVLEQEIEELYEARAVREVELAQVQAAMPEELVVQEMRLEPNGEITEQTAEETAQTGTQETDAGDGQENVRYVHLTFDDGPSVFTERILDILKEYDVKATFFVNGREDEYSLAMYRRILEEGHTLGMHSYSHRYGEIYASREAFIADTEKLERLLMDATGVQPLFYRFPGGSSNHVSSVNMNELIDWLEEQGITYFDWNVSSGDSSDGGLSVQQIVENCTATVANHEEPVILMHDSGAKRTTVEALPLVIEKIQAMDGVQITAITEDTEPVHHLR